MHFPQVAFGLLAGFPDLLRDQSLTDVRKRADNAIQHAQPPDRLDTVINRKVSPVLTVETHAFFAHGQARLRGALDQTDRLGIQHFIGLRRANVRLQLLPQNLISRCIAEHFQKSGVAQRRGTRPIQGIKPFRGGVQ